MKALILNSGMGKRMGVLTSEHPKCMTELGNGETILSRQLKLIKKNGIEDVVITTGAFRDVLEEYCKSLQIKLNYTFQYNAEYANTNYIYSIYLARQELEDDIILMHGDLVYEEEVLKRVLASEESCITVSSTLPLPKKDFKAVIEKIGEKERITKVGIEFFDFAVAAQPLYKLLRKDWKIWLDSIVRFCESNERSCYAENAFNVVSMDCNVVPLDVLDILCTEIDTPQDLHMVEERLK